MSKKPLGPGVRCYINWAPPGRVNPKAKDAICNIGTIIDGPYPRGSIFIEGGLNSIEMFGLKVDGMAGRLAVATYLLTPIDDDDEQAEPRQTERSTDSEVTA